MKQYSIKDLEVLSGIKAHTIRIWEQRYNIVEPDRTPGNIRLYDDDDLKKILNVSFLNSHGHKISRIAELSAGELSDMVMKMSENHTDFEEQIHSLTLCMIDLDEERFERLLTKSIEHIGFYATVTQIIYPFLHKIGILWMTGTINPAHEHFISNLVRQKLIVAIDNQVKVLRENHKKFLLYLPQDELHEISLLFSLYLIKSERHHTLYMGQSLPFENLVSSVEFYRPDYLVTFITTMQTESKTLAYIRQLADKFPHQKVLLSGYQVLQLNAKDLPANVHVFYKIDDLIVFLAGLR